MIKLNDKRIILLLYFLFFIIPLFSKTVDITFFTNHGELISTQIEDDSKMLFISPSFFPSSSVEENVFFERIEGFEKLNNLEILEINDIENLDNFNFLEDLPLLRELYIKNCHITDLKFLEKLQNLEILDLQIYVTEEEKTLLQDNLINFINDIFIFQINYVVYVISSDNALQAYDDVPPFINIQNQPVLNIGNNGISKISENQKEKLKQYSRIYLWPNPITNDNLQMEFLKDLNVVTR